MRGRPAPNPRLRNRGFGRGRNDMFFFVVDVVSLLDFGELVIAAGWMAQMTVVIEVIVNRDCTGKASEDWYGWLYFCSRLQVATVR